MFCRNCGTEIDENVKFCPSCGSPVNNWAPQEPVRDLANVQHSNANYGMPVRYLKTDRSLVVYILLSFVTCGIYSWFFIDGLAKDINIACNGDGEETAEFLKLFLLSIVTCGLYSYYFFYKLGNRLARNAPRYNMLFTENGTTVLMWMIFGSLLCGIGPLIGWNILIKNSNAICMAYNNTNN